MEYFDWSMPQSHRRYYRSDRQWTGHKAIPKVYIFFIITHSWYHLLRDLLCLLTGFNHWRTSSGQFRALIHLSNKITISSYFDIKFLNETGTFIDDTFDHHHIDSSYSAFGQRIVSLHSSTYRIVSPLLEILSSRAGYYRRHRLNSITSSLYISRVKAALTPAILSHAEITILENSW
jgi:hypothetical protein